VTRHLPARWPPWAGPALLTLAISAPALAQTEADGTAAAEPVAECHALAATPWPRSPQAQAALLRRMEAAAEACNGNALFLAALGGAWLEVGDAKRALLWLERALLLNSAMEAAQADHALALAVLGEPAARDELVHAWQGRDDVPGVLWKRLTQPQPDMGKGAAASPGSAPAAGSEGEPAPARAWAQFREIQLLVGHETNLAESPRLSELTITPPDGPITLPLDRPLQPRSGNALLLDMSWQGAVSLAPRRTFLLGVQASARHAPSASDTDWQSLRVAFSGSQRVGAWRWQAQGRANFTGGALNEDSRQWRLNLAAEGPAGPCSQRWFLEAEGRRYLNTAFNDAYMDSVASSLLCAVPGVKGWTLGLSGRWGEDRARQANRPGGDQQQGHLAARLLVELGRIGAAGGPWAMDAQWRMARTLDEEGYSALLENNARRSTKSQQLNLEFTGPWLQMPIQRAESVIQVQLSRQKSNIPVFSFDTASVYGGLRFKW